ncbi:putative short-chain dehydrogenase/reductase family protein [Lophiostoma macrostomum CBS 122681]|uniref:Putative short-chain dehydrogenase/reductase family protein n=1 Tax=Lophiostoma macrostomum CBS 122681 TaxID=1314788 RepID=A0A6A6T7R4_9PLEO|nr:putative short-chain dehydrogenase/reductase family protein [Lophiostoma macrostomum CBS 122681]
MTTFREILYNQLFVSIPKPKTDFTGQTCIVTGSNTGLGKEAARQLVDYNASKVVLAVRNLERGEKARNDIVNTTKRENVLEVWELDLSSFESVKRFASRCNEHLERLDCLIGNGAINTRKHKEVEDNESMLTINVMSTFLLSILLLPLCQKTARSFEVHPRITIIASDLHALASFPERLEPDIFAALNADKSFSGMMRRYGVTKLLVVLITRELAVQMGKPDSQGVILNCANPGFCHSEITRDVPRWTRPIFWFMHKSMARSTEMGSRAHVIAAAGLTATHGEYMDNGVISKASNFVRSEEGHSTQRKVYAQLLRKLEGIEPGISQLVAGK